MRNCNHRRIRKIYTHGRKSKPMLVCKDCGEVIKRYEKKKQKQSRREDGRKRNN